MIHLCICVQSKDETRNKLLMPSSLTALAHFREQHFRLQYRLIAPQVLTKLHGRFLFPLSGLSYKQSVSREDYHSADLVGAY